MATIFRAPIISLPRVGARTPSQLGESSGNPLLTTLAGKDALPHRQRDWPLPLVKGRQFELRTVTPAPPILAATALPLPITVADLPPIGKPFPVDLRTFLKPLDSYLVANQAAPFIQTDWPLPLVKPSPPLRNFELTPNPNLAGLDALPVRQTDWPLPVLRPRAIQMPSVYRPTQQDRFFGGLGQPPSYPPGPNPVGAPFPIELRRWTHANAILPLLNTVVQAPFVPVDWSLPSVKAYPVSLRTFAFYYVLDDSMPFGQNDWPIPTATPPSRELRTFTDPLRRLLIGVSNLPFLQSDWPNPIGKAAAMSLRTFTGAPAVQLTGLDALPFRLTDWPLPTGKPFPLELRTYLRSLDRLVLASDVPPSRQSEWVVPTGKPFPIELRTFLQRMERMLDTLYGGPGQPLFNNDWPLPQGKAFDRHLRTHLQNLLGSTLSNISTFNPAWAQFANRYLDPTFGDETV